ncbi:MAG: TSUP family transporter, partial [Pseudolabrys sp.]
MDLLHISLLALTGVAAGVIAAVVGGASLVTYPVLIALGMPPITAAVTTNVALVPSNFAAALADRKVLPPLDRGFVRLVVASVLGAAVGAGLLMATPERVFALIVPLLLGFATLMFAYSGQIAEWMRARADRSGRAL